MINETISEAASAESARFEEAFEQVKSEIERMLTGAPKSVRGYTAHLAQSWGKLIRARALLVCAQDGTGKIHPDALHFASAVELLHLATLVHDDVIDNADLRRGMETLHKKFDKRSAVICGDYLFCLALREASSVASRKDYVEFDMPDYMSRICLGELRQGQNNRNLSLSVPSYLRIIAGKTAALFEASFYAGAIACADVREDKEELKKYRRLGRNIGMIFQLTDDCIDFEAPERLAKKPVQSDYEQGVITLPLIYTLEKNADFQSRAREQNIPREEINSAVQKSGGLNYTRLISRHYYDKSAALIGSLQAAPEKKERLHSILDKAFRGL